MSIERTVTVTLTPKEAAEAVVDMDSNEQAVFLAELREQMSSTDWDQQLLYVVREARVGSVVMYKAREMMRLFGKWAEED